MEHQITKVYASDAKFIQELYRVHKKELGIFNNFMSWTDYIKGLKYKYYKIEGKGFVRYEYSPTKKMYHLHDIAVHPDYQGQGIGQALMNHMPRPFFLYCNITNVKGNRFYEKYGMINTEIKGEQYVWTQF